MVRQRKGDQNTRERERWVGAGEGAERRLDRGVYMVEG